MKSIKSFSLSIIVLFAIGFSQFASPKPAQAACSGIVYVSLSGNGTTGCSWTNAFTTLQSALAIAASGDQIWVAAGTYYPDEGTGQTNNLRTSTFQLINGISIYGGFAGTETLLSQRNSTTNVTILSGDLSQNDNTTISVSEPTRADNAYHVVTGSGTNATAILDGFTVTSGNDDRAISGLEGSGGGIVNNGGSPTLSNLIFTHNSAQRGAGMLNINAGNPSLSRTVFTNNAAALGGGGMNNQASAPVLTDVTFSVNTATSGGGMFNGSGANPSLNRVTFDTNSASRRGGGMGSEGNSSPTLTNVTFFLNTSSDLGASPLGGGAIFQDTGSLNLKNVTLSGNSSPSGGGIRASVANLVHVDNSIFWSDQVAPTDEITADASSTVTILYSVIEGGCPAIVGITCNNIITTSPNLSALANNNGFTQSMAIGIGSSALNAGNNDTCAATDQRGVIRPQGGTCDIGAYEAEAATAPTLLSFTRQTPASSPTNADTLVFRATFDVAVLNVDTADFAVNSTTTATVTNVNTASTTAYDITVSGGDLAGFNGLAGVNLSGSQNITDTSANPLPAGEPATDEVYLVDNLAPTITINNPTTAPAQSKTITASTTEGTLTMSNTTGSICDGTLTFIAYTSQTFTSEADNGKKVCYRAIDTASNTTYNLSNAIAGIDTTAPIITINNPSTAPAQSKTITASTSEGNLTMSNTTGSICDGTLTFIAYTSQTFTSEADNGKKVCYRAIDAASNTTYNLSNAIAGIDATAPNTSITANPSNPTNSTSASFSFTGSDPGGSGVASFECKLDGAAFTACTSPRNYSSLSDGVHTFQVRAIDNVGNIDGSPASFTWTVDTAAPDTSITNNPTNPSSASASFSFGGSDPGGSGVASFECKLDGAAFAACTSPQNLTGLSAGSHTFQVRAIDSAGNVDASPDSFTWSVDVNAPDTSITANPSDPSNSNSASFSFTGSDLGGAGVASFECKLDGAAFAVCTSPRDYSSLSDGSHTFQVRAIDGAGNTDASPASFTWTVDTAAPDTSITSNPNNPTNSTSASFSFTGSDLGSGVASFECKLDGAAFATCTSPQNYSSLSNGSHTFQVRAIDNFGHTDTSPASFTWTVDTAAPNTFITASPSNPTNSTSASFSFTGSDPGGSGVASFKCKLDGAAFAACTSPQNLTSLSDGSHTFQVHAIDNAGNPDPSPTSFTWTVDTIAPIITINNPSTAPAQSKTITASSSEGTLTMSNTTGSICDGTLTFVAYTSQTFTSEADNGKKVCYRAIDAASNSTYNLSNAIAGIDTTSPIVTSFTATSPTTSLDISVTAFVASDAVGVSGYMITTSAAAPASGAAGWSATAPSTYHVNATGTYTLYPWAKDAAGNVSTAFGTGVSVTVTWVGGVSISADKNIVAVGRPHIGSEVASYGGFSSGSLTAYVPMLFKTAFGSYDSALYVQNVHETNIASITIKYYDSGGTLNCTETDTIAPLSSKGYWVPSVTCDTGSLPDGWVGGVVVTSTQPIVAVGRPHVGSEVMTYDGFASGSLTSYIPMLFNGAFGGSYNAAFYVQNTHASNTASITMEYYDSDGTLNCVKTDTIAPLASKGYWVPAATCDIGILPSGWVGGVVVTSTQPIVAVGRPHIGTQVTTYTGFAGGSLSSYVPMLFSGAFGGSYNAAFYLQNADVSNTANITIKYYDSGGVLNCTETDTIAPLSSKGYWVPSATCDSGSLPVGWVGGVVVTSDQPIVAVGRPHLGEQITTYNGFTSGSLNAYLPMLFNAAFGGSYNAAFYIQNTENSAAAVTIKFYDTSGNLSCTRAESIPALSTVGYWVPSVSCTP